MRVRKSITPTPLIKACCLTPTVLNIWSHLHLPDVYYPGLTYLARMGFSPAGIINLAQPHTLLTLFLFLFMGSENNSPNKPSNSHTHSESENNDSAHGTKLNAAAAFRSTTKPGTLFLYLFNRVYCIARCQLSSSSSHIFRNFFLING